MDTTNFQNLQGAIQESNINYLIEELENQWSVSFSRLEVNFYIFKFMPDLTAKLFASEL